MLLSRVRVLGAVGFVAVIIVAVAIVFLLGDGGGSDETASAEGTPEANASFDLAAYPEIEAFMARDPTILPADVRERMMAALESGGLHPTQFQLAVTSWRGCDEQRCVGTVLNAGASSLTIETTLDGHEWSVSLGQRTRILPSGYDLSGLTSGLFVEVFAQDGKTADFVLTFAEPLP